MTAAPPRALRRYSIHDPAPGTQQRQKGRLTSMEAKPTSSEPPTRAFGTVQVDHRLCRQAARLVVLGAIGRLCPSDDRAHPGCREVSHVLCRTNCRSGRLECTVIVEVGHASVCGLRETDGDRFLDRHGGNRGAVMISRRCYMFFTKTTRSIFMMQIILQRNDVSPGGFPALHPKNGSGGDHLCPLGPPQHEHARNPNPGYGDPHRAASPPPIREEHHA